MRKNNVKEILKNGGCVYGTFVKMNDPLVIEMIGVMGFDFFVLDNEHVAMSRKDMVNILRAADFSEITSIVRVRENKNVEILQALDAGALGVQVPNVDTYEEAISMVDSVKYNPIGKRGLSPTVRAADYGLMDKFEYVKKANENTMIVSHCETVECMNNLDEILKIDDIDVIFIGPMDLSQSLGVICEANHPKVKESVDLIIKKVLNAGKIVGTVAGTVEKAKELKDKGVQYILFSSDQGMMANTGKAFLKEIKK